MSEIFNVSTNPHVRSGNTTQTIMRDVLIALTPASIFGIVNFGLDALLRIVIGIVTCVACEALYQYFMHKKVTVTDLSAAVTGLLIAYTGPMTNFVTSNGFLDAYSGATPLALLKPGAESTGVVSLAKMFIGTTGGVIGETSAICLLLGGIYLLARKVINWRIPVIYVGVFAALIFLFAPGHHFDVIYMLEEVCGGGLLLGAIFMATDYVTSPITPNGKIVFGCCLGLLTFIFRMYGGSAEGVSYAIIFCNLLVPLIERVTVPKSFGKKKPEKKAKEAA